MSEINRRDFVVGASLVVLAAGAASVATAGTAGNGSSTQPAVFDVGTVSDYPKDGTVKGDWIKSHKVAVLRTDGKIYACSSVCPHKGCATQPQEDHLYCHCHKTTFSPEGVPIQGPAKKPLPRYAISVNSNGHIMVDTSHSFDQTQWTDPGSFVPAS